MPEPSDAIKRILGTSKEQSSEERLAQSPTLQQIATNGSLLIQNVSKLTQIIDGWR
mgnify:CR=1 FL=1